jgi:hypothetical protein
MKRLLTVGMLTLCLLSSRFVSADATVLPQGTVISFPDGMRLDLNDGSFLLDRMSMEEATNAMADVPILHKQISDLTLSFDDMKKLAKQKEAEADVNMRGMILFEILTVVGTVGGFILGILVK